MMDILTRIPARTTHLERSFIVQRRGMAFLAAIFPFAFLASSFAFGRTQFQTSMSAYYWTGDTERNFFVGVLCAIGVFLFLYKGYTILEDRVLDVAGISAIGIAFFPMAEGSDCASTGISAHGTFAVIFFACIAFICIFMSEYSLEKVEEPSRKKAFRHAYRICSGVMIASILLAAMLRLLPSSLSQKLCQNHAIFWLEAFGVWAFSAFWYIKTRELDPSVSWNPFRWRRASE